MTRVLVLDGCGWSHVEAVANAVVHGARSVPGVHLDIARAA